MPDVIVIKQAVAERVAVNPAPVVINNIGGSTTPATTSALGVVIIGANLSITPNGVLSAIGGGGSATTNMPFANLTGLPATLALHGITDGLTAANLTGYLLFSTANATYSVLGHTHTIPNVTGLQTALDGKQVSGSYVLTSNSALTDARTPLAHTQAWSTITGTPTLLGVGGYGITDGLTAATAASTYLAQATAASTYVTASDANNAFVVKTTSVLPGTGLTGGGALNFSRTLSLAVSNVTAGTYGSATVVPVVAVDIYGRITSVSNIAISGGGGVTSVTGGTGITVTGTTTPSVAIDSTVATLTGTQTLTNKSIAAEQLNSGTLANARLGVSNTTLTYAASVTWAADYLKVATITLTGACSLTISGLSAGGTYNLIVKQDATGSRIVTWVTTVKWSAGAAPVLSTAANAIDIVSLIYDGTTLFGTALKGFA